MIHILIPILAGLSVFLIGGALLVARHERRARLAARLATTGNVQLTASTEDSPMIRAVSSLGNASWAGKASRSLREELARAGFHSKSAASTFIGAKMLLLIFSLGLGLIVVSFWRLSVMNSTLFTMSLAMMFFYLPNMIVAMRRRKRLREIVHHLPDAIDLLEISVTAGMGMDQAWNAVSDEVRGVCIPLADEMALTNLEIHLGASRPIAMRHMSERTGATDLGSLVACMVQAERFGTSMQEALRNFAITMRETRSQRAQEVAERMPVKMLFPMILLFAAAVSVMAGPAFVALYDAMVTAAR